MFPLFKRLNTASSCALVGRSLQYLSQFALILVLPKILLPDSYLLLNLILPIAYLCATATFGWMISSIYRYAHDILDSQHPQYRGMVFFYYLAGIAVLTLISIPLAGTLDSPYALIPIVLIAAALKNGITGILNASERHRDFLLANIGFALSLSAFLASCYLQEGKGLWVPLLTYAGFDILVGLIFWFRCGIFSLKTRPRYDHVITKQFLRYGTPIVLNNILVWIIALSDRYLLNIWEDTTHVASYVLSYQFASSSITIPMAFLMTIIYPKILRIHKDKGEEAAMTYVNRAFKQFKRYSLPASIAASLIVIPFMNIFFAQYAIDPLLVIILILAHIIMSASHFLNKEFELNGQTILITRVLIAAALANVIFNVMLIPFLGTIGAAISTLLAYGIMVGMVYRKNTYLRQRRLH